MKSVITALLLFTAATSQAQIKLEQSYLNYDNTQNRGARWELGLIEVDSGDFKYINFNLHDSIYIYNLDHSLDRIIIVPVDTSLKGLHIACISKRLFNTDDAYEYLLQNFNPNVMKVFNEQGDVLFGCTACAPYTAGNYTGDVVEQPSSIVSTPTGVKFLVEYYETNKWFVSVFGLPGKLPHGRTSLAAGNPSVAAGLNPASASAYPNPSDGQFRIEYKLPEGVSGGELLITDMNGREVKKYEVGNIFTDILIDRSDLASGSYLYKLITSKGESAATRIVVLK